MATQEVTALPNPPKFNMKAEEFRPNMPLAKLRESDLNPRKHYNQHKLEELAESIRTRGVITPLLARPVKGGMHEIAAGHRRFRAAQLAGLQWAPVRIMDLDDDAFLEVVSIENLQREDIHPLEEGDGFRELLKRNGYDVHVLADKIGKSEAYVRGRLELCDLIPVVRQSFLDDNITIGHARLISRLNPDKQEEALQQCFEDRWYNGNRSEPELVSLREFRHWLKGTAGADLSKAPFTLDDIVAAIGPCTACPKCTGVQRSLLADDTSEQLCLDRPCYDKKVQSHIQGVIADGYVQITHTGKKQDGVLSFDDYVEAEAPIEQIDEVKGQIEYLENDPDERAQPGAEKELANLRQELAELEADNGQCPHMENAVHIDGRNLGQTIAICRNPECPKHGKDLQNGLEVSRSKSHSGSSSDEWKKQQAKAEEKRKIHAKARKRAWEALLSAMGPSPKVDRFFLQAVAHGLYHRFNEDFCKAFGIDWKKGDSAREKGKAWTETATDAQLIRAILAAAFWEPGLQEYFNVEYSGKDIWQMFCTGLAKYGTSFEKIEKQVKAEIAEQAKAKAAKPAKKKADTPTTPKPAKSSKMAAAGDGDEDGEGEE